MGRTLVSLLIALTAVVLSPAPASAHGNLAHSNPASGATLTEALGALTLVFTEQPAPFAYFTLTAPSGVRVDRPWSPGASFRLDQPVREYHRVNGVWEPQEYHTGYPVSLPVAHWPEQGQYVAAFQSVATDGGQVRGEVRFTYSGPMSAAPAGWTAPTDAPKPELLAAGGHARPASETPGAPGVPGVPGNPGDSGSLAAPPAPERTWVLPTVLLLGGIAVIGLVAVLRRRSAAATPAAPPARQAKRRPAASAGRKRR
jgi:methionine-rich copper-binding protein CopC